MYEFEPNSDHDRRRNGKFDILRTFDAIESRLNQTAGDSSTIDHLKFKLKHNSITFLICKYTFFVMVLTTSSVFVAVAVVVGIGYRFLPLQ